MSLFSVPLILTCTLGVFLFLFFFLGFLLFIWSTVRFLSNLRMQRTLSHLNLSLGEYRINCGPLEIFFFFFNKSDLNIFCLFVWFFFSPPEKNNIIHGGPSCNTWWRHTGASCINKCSRICLLVRNNLWFRKSYERLPLQKHTQMSTET